MLVVPGANVLLGRVAQQLDGRPDVSMMNTANALLWQLRCSPAAHVLAATELPDFDAVELAEMVHALRPDTYLMLCGPETAELRVAAQQPNVELVSSVHSLAQYLQRLNLTAPTSSSPLVPRTAPEPPDLLSWSAQMASRGHQVVGGSKMGNVRRVLQTLSDTIGALAVVLSDVSGMTIAQIGSVPDDAQPLYAPMLATLFSTAQECRRMLDDADAERLYVQSGARYHLLALAIDNRRVLSALRRAGNGGRSQQPVLAAIQRAVRELREGEKM